MDIDIDLDMDMDMDIDIDVEMDVDFNLDMDLDIDIDMDMDINNDMDIVKCISQRNCFSSQFRIVLIHWNFSRILQIRTLKYCKNFICHSSSQIKDENY